MVLLNEVLKFFVPLLHGHYDFIRTDKHNALMMITFSIKYVLPPAYRGIDSVKVIIKKYSILLPIVMMIKPVCCHDKVLAYIETYRDMLVYSGSPVK